MINKLKNTNSLQNWVVLTVVLGLLVSLLASGSTGMLNHSLRHVLTWIGAALILFIAWPGIKDIKLRVILLLIYFIFVIGFTHFSLTTTRLTNLFTFIIFYAVISYSQSDKDPCRGKSPSVKLQLGNNVNETPCVVYFFELSEIY